MPCKYTTDEERIKAKKIQQNYYSRKDWKCDTCDCVISLGNKSKHFNSYKHNKSSDDSERTWTCDVCDIEMNLYSKGNHLKSDRHLRNKNDMNV